MGFVLLIKLVAVDVYKRQVGILTLGCKVNTYESEYIIHLLKEAGYQIKDFLENGIK